MNFSRPGFRFDDHNTNKPRKRNDFRNDSGIEIMPPRKWKEEDLYPLIKEHVLTGPHKCFNGCKLGYFTKEEVAIFFGAQEKMIEKIFRRLNKEGILGQAVKHPMGHRDRWNIYLDPEFGWAGDKYYKNKGL